MSENKVKAFVARILEECEQEGLTVDEALQIPLELKIAIHSAVDEMRRHVKLVIARHA